MIVFECSEWLFQMYVFSLIALGSTTASTRDNMVNYLIPTVTVPISTPFCCHSPNPHPHHIVSIPMSTWQAQIYVYVFS